MLPYDTEFLNSNRFRAYPLAENATRVAQDNYVLPNSLILDLVLLSFPTENLPLYVSQVALTNLFCEVRIADSDGTVVTSLMLNTGLHTDPASYNLTGLNAYSNIRGHIIVGSVTEAVAAGVGTHLFAPEATSFESTCILPSTPRVETLSSVTADGIQSTGLVGPVLLKEGTNIRLKNIPEENAIQIDAVEGINVDCTCDDPFCGYAKPISRVNGISADNGCNINIRGVGCINVSAQGNTILIEDTCSSVNCSECCKALNDLLAKIAQLENAGGGTSTSTGGGGGSGSGDQRAYIYDPAKPTPNICSKDNWLSNCNYIWSFRWAPGPDCGGPTVPFYLPSGQLNPALQPPPDYTPAQADSLGYYWVEPGTVVDITLKVANDILPGTNKQMRTVDANKDAALGLVVDPLGDHVRIHGTVSYNSHWMSCTQAAIYRTWSIDVEYETIPTDPATPVRDCLNNPKTILRHTVTFFLKR